jgi:hypothetical protein
MARGRKSGSGRKSREIHTSAIPLSDLLPQLHALIRRTRDGVARAVRSALGIPFRQVGDRIRSEILQHQWADDSEGILPTRSAKWLAEFGERYDTRNLARIVRSAKLIPDREIIATRFRRLGRSGIRVASDRTELPPRDVLERKFHEGSERAKP